MKAVPKKKKRTGRKAAVKRNDALWREIVYKRWGGVCVMSGPDCSGPLAPHHWLHGKKAGGYAVRWIVANGMPLCTKHHFLAHQSGKFHIQLAERITELPEIMEVVEQWRKKNELDSPSFDFVAKEHERLTRILSEEEGNDD